jgi:hypothetical protein
MVVELVQRAIGNWYGPDVSPGVGVEDKTKMSKRPLPAGTFHLVFRPLPDIE